MYGPPRSWLISQQRVAPWSQGVFPKPRTSVIPVWMVGSKTVSVPQDDTWILIRERKIRVQQMEHKVHSRPGRGRTVGAVQRASGMEDWREP